MRVLGLAVMAGTMNFGLIEDRDGEVRLVSSGPERLVPSPNLDQAGQVHDFAGRFRQVLREVRPEVVVIVATRKHAQWKYRDAYDRAALIVTAMLQCTAEGINVSEMKTEAISKVVSVPADRLQLFDHTSVGFAVRPKYWTTGRAEAFAAAVARIAAG